MGSRSWSACWAGFTALGAVIAGVATLLGAGSAAGSLAIARKTDDPDLLGTFDERARAELTGGDADGGLHPAD